MDIAREARVNHNGLQNFSMNRAIIANLSENKQDTILMAYAKFGRTPSNQELIKFEEWLKIRTKVDSLTLIVD